MLAEQVSFHAQLGARMSVIRMCARCGKQECCTNPEPLWLMDRSTLFDFALSPAAQLLKL